MALESFVNTFAGGVLDRASERRADADWIAARLADPTSRSIALWNGAVLVQERAGGGARLTHLPPPLARGLASGEERLLFLGLDRREAAVFAVDLEAPADPAEGPLQGHGRFEGLRGLASRLEGAEAAAAATAKAVFEWRRRHRFCSVCGEKSEVREAGWKRFCPACTAEHFPRTDPVAIMLPVQGERCLLGRQAAWPAGMHSALAGFMEPGESIEEACARELKEEAGLDTVQVRYHSSQPWPFPSNLMIGLIAEVADGEARADQNELEAVRWFSRPQAQALMEGRLEDASAPMPLAIAHQLIRSWAYG